MIYSPRLYFDYRLAIGQAVLKTALEVLEDFTLGVNKDWAFYTGVLTGELAAATHIPGAAGKIFVVGQAVDLLLFRSPEGSLVRSYLNGVLSVELDTFSETAGWDTFTIPLAANVFTELVLENVINNNPAKTSSVNRLAIGGANVINGYAVVSEDNMITLAIRIRDAEQNSPLATIPIYLPNGLTVAQVQDYLNAIAPEIDALTDGVIAEASVTFNLVLPAGMSETPVSGALNERGGLITFDTTGPRKSSVRVPAFDRNIMPGDSFSLAQSQVAAFVTRLTTSTTTHNIRPVTEQGYQYTVARAGRKSFRKQ